MMRLGFLMTVFVMGVPAVAQGVVLSHLPKQIGFSTSDTEVVTGDVSYAQNIADDFELATPADIRQITWWGGYLDDIAPTENETFRIRLYESGDGLPDLVLFEAIILNALREPTGLEIVGAGVMFPEYIFTANLAAPVSLNAGTPYWLEIVQLGDPTSEFAWEHSATDNSGFAFLRDDGQWQRVFSDADLALQLSSIPEPAAAGLTVIALSLIGRRSKRFHILTPI